MPPDIFGEANRIVLESIDMIAHLIEEETGRVTRAFSSHVLKIESAPLTMFRPKRVREQHWPR